MHDLAQRGIVEGPWTERIAWLNKLLRSRSGANPPRLGSAILHVTCCAPDPEKGGEWQHRAHGQYEQKTSN